MYLAQHKLSCTKTAIHKVEMLAEKYILLDSLLFKLVTTPKKEMALLTIQEICADKIITLYHSSLICRASRHDKNVPNNWRQILHTRFDTLPMIIYKRLSHMPTV